MLNSDSVDVVARSAAFAPDQKGPQSLPKSPSVTSTLPSSEIMISSYQGSLSYRPGCELILLTDCGSFQGKL
jgi:hypothetical protein